MHPLFPPSSPSSLARLDTPASGAPKSWTLAPRIPAKIKPLVSLSKISAILARESRGRLETPLRLAPLILVAVLAYPWGLGFFFPFAGSCRLGWTGQNCESRGDCASNPCQNNANCQPRASGIGFDCLCIGAFYGTLCESKWVLLVASCARLPRFRFHSHKTCVARFILIFFWGGGGFPCPPLATIAPDACAAKPCESLATCHRNGSSHYCTCDRTDGVCVSDASTGNSKNKGAGLLSMPVIIGIAAAGCLLVLLMVYVLACRGGYKKKAVKRRNVGRLQDQR